VDKELAVYLQTILSVNHDVSRLYSGNSVELIRTAASRSFWSCTFSPDFVLATNKSMSGCRVADSYSAEATDFSVRAIEFRPVGMAAVRWQAGSSSKGSITHV
jgi:hypothetical protein